MVTITDWNDLDAVRNDLTADYTLENDLDSSTAGYTGIGDDWTPLGFVSDDGGGNPFSGTFNGQGYQISDLVIEENNSPQGGVAFITQVGDGGLVENLTVDGTVDSTIDHLRYSGLAASLGLSGTGTVQNCMSHIDVTASNGNFVGGLVGDTSNGSVTDSYATGSIDGDSQVGGLVGYNNDTLTDSYAIGSVDGGSYVGGLVGYNGSTIQTSYAVGSVTGNTNVGALVGTNEFADELSDSYADEQTTGQTSLTGTTGGPNTNSRLLTTSEMQGDEASNTDNMDGFDYTNNWDTVLAEDNDTSADGYPILQSVDRQNQLEAQGVALVTVSESGAVSAITTPTTIETTAFIESGSITATATGSGTETTAVIESGAVGATATPTSIETGRATEAGAIAAAATPVAIETTASIESGGVTATATPAGIETARATEVGNLTALSTPEATAAGRIGESGSATALATPDVIESATSSIVRVAPRRTLDKQLRAIARVLDLDES